MALRQRLGGQKPTSIAFMDLPKTAPDAYAQWVMISRLVGFGDMLGVQSPAMLLPPLPKLMQHLSPAGSAAWADKDGWHVRSITPFPGSTILASDPTVSALGFAPLMAGIAMPALSRARHVAVEQQSMTQLRQIGMGAIMYSADHKGVFPKTLGEILPYVEQNAGLFVYPTSGKEAPAPGEPAAAAKWVDANSDYVYLAAGMKAAQIKNSAEVVIAHERFGLSPQGVGALFADGHVERLPQSEVQRRAVKPQAAGGSARPEAAPPGGRPAPPRIAPPPAPPRPTPPAPRPPRAPQPPR
jgi:prepilin-type processing-associated H-X9-DG protein